MTTLVTWCIAEVTGEVFSRIFWAEVMSLDFMIREKRPEAATKETYTYGDYLSWSDEERWELIDGIPYNMAPAPSRAHQEISVELVR